jgi:chromosome segregation ATPase
VNVQKVSELEEKVGELQGELEGRRNDIGRLEGEMVEGKRVRAELEQKLKEFVIEMERKRVDWEDTRGRREDEVSVDKERMRLVEEALRKELAAAREELNAITNNKKIL